MKIFLLGLLCFSLISCSHFENGAKKEASQRYTANDNTPGDYGDRPSKERSFLPTLIKNNPPLNGILSIIVFGSDINQSTSGLGEAICRAGGGGSDCAKVGIGEGICRAGGGGSNCAKVGIGEGICRANGGGSNCAKVGIGEGICRAGGGGSDCARVSIGEGICRAGGGGSDCVGVGIGEGICRANGGTNCTGL